MRKIYPTIICFVFIYTFICTSIVISSENIRCTGKVIDATGRPIAEAKVAVYEMYSDGIAGNILLSRVGDISTDKNGAFFFETESKPTKGTFLDSYIVVTKQGQSLGWAVWDMHENAEVEIEIGRPAKLEGIIVGETGKPVAGAQVRANLSRKIKTDNGEKTSQWLPGISPLDELGTKTDAQGRFSFNNLPADSDVDLLVKADGKASIYTYQSGVGSAFKAGQTDVKVVVPDEARIAGKIIDLNTGKGVGRTKFAVVATFSGMFYYRFVGTTNDDGTFNVGGLQTGRYLIRGDFPSIHVDVMSGKCTSDVLIGVNRQEDEPTPRRTKTGPEERIQIYVGMRILEIPADVNTDIFEQDHSISNGIFVRSGHEFASTLLELAQKNKSTRVLTSPQLLTFMGKEAKISIAAEEYVSGYELAEDGSGELLPKMKSLIAGDYKIKGVLKGNDSINLTLSGGLRQPVFETRQYRKGYDYHVPLPGQYFSVEGITKNNEPLTVGLLRPDKPTLYLIITPSCLLPEPKPESLIGKALPKFENIQNIMNSDNIEGKPVLVCFFDMQQRPSRNCLIQLNKKAQELQEKSFDIVAIQASKIDDNALNEWLKDQNISFQVGTIVSKEKETRLAWGVKSLPWLILTDAEHIVTAEGFSISELDEKLK